MAASLFSSIHYSIISLFDGDPSLPILLNHEPRSSAAWTAIYLLRRAVWKTLPGAEENIAQIPAGGGKDRRIGRSPEDLAGVRDMDI